MADCLSKSLDFILFHFCKGDLKFLPCLRSREYILALVLARNMEPFQMVPVFVKVVISVLEYHTRTFTVFWLFPLMVIANLAPESISIMSSDLKFLLE